MSQLSDELRRICENEISSLTPSELGAITLAADALDAAPAWHPRPTCAGLWIHCLQNSFDWVWLHHLDSTEHADPFRDGQWYGPIPQPEKAVRRE